jgi:hypothetical protein
MRSVFVKKNKKKQNRNISVSIVFQKAIFLPRDPHPRSREAWSMFQQHFHQQAERNTKKISVIIN